MRNECERLYRRRKSGKGMSLRYKLGHFSPSLLVFLIVLTLTFVMVFMSSMTGAIERMIVLLGCGSVTTTTPVDVSGYRNARSDEVKEGDGILYASSGKSLVHLKGVNISEYFSGERETGMKLTLGEESWRNEIIISSTLASSLSLEIGDQMTLLLYEKEKGRARPLLMTVKGIYSSGYAQLDKYLGFVDISLVDGDSSYEILLDKNEDIAAFLSSLWKEGIYAESYRTKYSALCTNVDQSVMILNVILIFVALLAAFFSADIAHVYTSRDRRDIASLRLLGLTEKSVRGIYRRMTIESLTVSSVLGTAAGLLLSLLSPSLISFVARKEPDLIEYYISSFTLSVPYRSLVLMLVLMILCSSVTLRIELWRTRGAELSGEIKGE